MLNYINPVDLQIWNWVLSAFTYISGTELYFCIHLALDTKAMEFKRGLDTVLQAGDTLRKSSDNTVCRKIVFVIVSATPEAKSQSQSLNNP